MAEVVVRPAEPGDIDGIAALVADRLDPEDAPEARLVLEDEAWDRSRWLVAADGPTMAATMVVVESPCRVGETEVGGNQIEFVATSTAYGGRGLQRRLFAEAHRAMLERGELVTVIVGIPYFYRQLGYEYAVPNPDQQIVAKADPIASSGAFEAGIATTADLGAIARLNAAAQAPAGVATRPGDALARWVARSPNYRTVVVRDLGEPVGSARLYTYGDDSWAMDVTARDGDVLGAVIVAARELVPGDLRVLHRPAVASGLAGIGTHRPSSYAYYARVGDPLGFLEAIRPTLSTRLAASPLADAAGQGMISLYRSSITFEYDHGEVGGFAPGGPVQAPVSAGGSGVPPDLFATLTLGPLGAAELERRYTDVLLGKQSDLMQALFPPQVVDVMTWVVP